MTPCYSHMVEALSTGAQIYDLPKVCRTSMEREYLQNIIFEKGAHIEHRSSVDLS